MKIETLLGFDYGTKRIGVAIGQLITGTATPLDIIKVRNNKPDWELIDQLVNDWQPDAFIIGSPLKLNGTTQEMTFAAEKFQRQIQGRYHLPVFGMDERLSSMEASEYKKSTVSLDSIAACLILESWMRENNDKFANITKNQIQSD